MPLAERGSHDWAYFIYVCRKAWVELEIYLKVNMLIQKSVLKIVYVAKKKYREYLMPERPEY